MGRFSFMGKLDQKSLKIATGLTEEFFELLSIKIKPFLSQDSEGALNVSLEGTELGILIGYHGETLESLQLLLSLIINRQLATGESWLRVTLDVGNWRAEREEIVRRMVEEAARKVDERGEPSRLAAMTAAQRRLVHLILADFPSLQSVSEGEDPNRYVVISKKE